MARGWCKLHWQRWSRTGKPEGVTRLDRLVAKINKTDECWIWTGSLASSGYGRFQTGQKYAPAHRAVYETFVGPIPDGLQLDHLCRNRACVNPDHLEPVTGRVNTLRGETLPALNVTKTTCPEGHPYDAVRNGRRACKTCRARDQRAYLARKAA